MKAFPNVATRTGDAGETSLWCGQRVKKTDPRIALVGDIDLALSALGRCHQWLTEGFLLSVSEALLGIQERFIALMGELACSEKAKPVFRQKRDAISKEDLAKVESLYQNLHKALSQQERSLERWQVYGKKGAAAADCYYARACFRQAELATWRLREAEYSVRDELLQILNRMSDLLFLIAVYLEDV